LSEVPSEHLRERLLAMAGAQLLDADLVKLLQDLIGCGGGVTLELDEMRVKLIRREGRFILKKEDPRRASSSMPPRSSRRPGLDPER
jgi:hypothetical protein